jgi:hypothetical protein
VSAAPADRVRRAAAPALAPTGAHGKRAAARRAERRRRERHFRRRRRDLLEDAIVALLAALILISVTAGLGVLALLEMPLAMLLITSSLIERRSRGRRGAAQRRLTRSRRSGAGASPR